MYINVKISMEIFHYEGMGSAFSQDGASQSSEEHGNTMSQASQPSSEEHKKTISQTSQPSSEETRKTMSQVAHPSSDEHKKTISQTSQPSSEETRKTISQTSQSSSEEHKNTMSHASRPSEELKKPSQKDRENDAMAAQTTTQLKLPHGFEAIMKDADLPIDRSSVEKLYTQLYNGVFFNQKRKKYWVERKSNSNCFMLFARDLSITWSEDNRFWHWPDLQETGDVRVDVAELQTVCWLEVHGRFEISKLSPGVTYRVTFVLMLKDPAYGWEVPVNFRLILPDGIKQERKEKLMEKPRGQWIEIPAGEFKTSSEKAGEIEFSMYEYEGGEWKRGLVIKGAKIQPKI